MKLKLDENGNVVLQDGKPVYVHDDGREVAFDAAATVATITRLNGESKTHRERAEAAEAKAKAYEGIDDPAAAKKALETIKNLDDKKLVDAGEVERIKTEAIKAVEENFKPIVAERDRLFGELRKEKIGGSFARSKFVSDNLTIPPDFVEARFGNHFELEDGKVVAKFPNGEKIFSRARPGELADFDEALSELVGQYSQKDQILKGTSGSGGGAGGGQGGQGGGGKKSMKRGDFDALDPAAKAAHVNSGGAITD
ncbi:MAG: DUF6651 domain-containing protein [Pseudomonadota bacterium]|nr:DUF6651 domain-containing protein [Pseudomonadota bacterium]